MSNDKNQDIGDIEDVIVSPKKTVSWAIIGVGGFLGIGEKLVAQGRYQGAAQGDAGVPLHRSVTRFMCSLA
jgi:PRC-barrel domain protein